MKQIIFICLFFLFTHVCSSQTTPYFTISKKQGCVPMTVNFSDSSYNGTVTKRDWDLGGQLIANGAKDQGKNFTTAGDYAIKLTVTFSNGDVKTKIDTIHVYPLPVADLVVMNASDTAGCVSHNVQFKSLSTTAVGTIKNYTWDFGGGGTSGTNPTPLFTYKDPGKYTVSLIVENSFGCKSNAATKNNYIKVYPAVVPSFTINGNFSCDTFLLSSFINTTTGGTGLNYKWYFGDGDSTEVVTTDTLKHLYKKPGAYTVTLVVTSASNCKGTYTTPLNNRVFVGKPKPAITCKDTVCSYASMEYTGTSDPAASAYRWIFSDRNTVINARYTNYTFKTSGTYEVILIAYNAGGCSDTVKKTVFVKDAPAAEFTMDQKIGCALPFPVQFTYPGNGNYNYKWDFGDQTPPVTVQSPTHTYTSQGYYSVTFTVTDPATGCSNSLLKSSVIAIAIPTVDFVYTPSSGCKPLKVTTTAQVTNLLPPLTITKYSWDFGDGSKLDTTVTSVSHTYTSNGNFFIRLVIVSSTGCVDTSLSKQVIVSDLCDDDGSTDGGGGQSGFVIGKSCQDKYMVKFVDTVKNSRTIKWDFGDNTVVSTGNLNPITHTYQPPQKIYTVTITRTDTVTNVTSSSQKRIVIIDEKANFSADMTNACQGMQVNFKTIGIDSSRIKKYYWDYGDQTKITLDNAAYYLQSGKYMNGDASHVYLENGVFPVKLIIEDKLGCLDSMIYPVPIRIKGPVAGFIATPLIGCGKELEVTFNDTSLRNGSIPIVKRIWDFGDGSPIDTIASTDTTVKHVYAGNRVFTTYTVKLKVIDSIGCVSEEIRIDHIKRYYPQVNMYSNDTLLCGRLDVKLFNSSNAYNATYLWSFGDSTTSNTYNATHSYTKTGIYTIKLVVTDQGGCKDSITRLSYIKLVKPKADFIIGDTSQCAPVTITFRDTSSYATSYQWFFGDADGGTNKNPAPHIYGEPGNYKVKLAIVGVSGCVDTITKIIHINGPIGKLNVGPTPGCVPYTFHMGVDGSNIKTFAWDFGDGTPVLPMVDSSINHVYLQAGKYLPNAILTSPEGCVVTLKTKDSVIVDELHSNFTILPYAHCDSASVQFVDLSTVSIFSSIVKTEWLFGDDSTAIGPLTGPHNYKYPGVYTVSLITTSAYGCKDTLTKTDSIQVRQSPQVMMTGDSIICLTPGSVLNYQSFTASQDSISLYTWAIDDAAVSSDRYLNYDYRKGGVHDLKFIATTIYGCSASIKKTIFIDSIKANIGINSLSFCSSGTVELKNQTTSVSAVKEATWNLGNGTLLNGMDTSYTFTKPGSYLIKLIATNSNNCRDVEQTTKAIDVFPLPKASIVGDTLLCLPGDATYTSKVISTDSITQFVWNLDDTKIDSLKVFQSFFRQGDHDLKLAVRSATGCVDTVTKHIVVDLLKADFGVLTPILCDKADSARFINLTVGGAYNLSYEWLFGDGTNLITTTTTTPHAYLKPPGIYDVLLIAKSASGCVDSTFKKQAIHQYRNPIVDIARDSTFCMQQQLTFAVTLTADDSIVSMEWRVDSMPVSTTPDLKLMYVTPGVHTISYEAITNHGCIRDTTFELTIHPLPIPVATADTTICLGSSVQLQANDGDKYKWSPSHGLNNTGIPNPIAIPERTIQYVVQVLNQFGCMQKDTVNISVDKPVHVEVKDIPPICDGDSIQLKTVTNATKFIWTPPQSLSNDTIASPYASPTITTGYKVIAYSLNVCPNDSARTTVNVGEIPELKMVSDTSVVGGSTIQVVAQVSNVPVSYSWAPPTGLSCTDCPDPIIRNIKEDETFILTVTSAIGCIAIDTIRIKTFCGENLWIPNAFTPNNNGVNEVFYPQAPGYGIVRSMTIYDRWGQVVFTQEEFPLNDPSYGWDGRQKDGRIVGPDVYTYVIHFVCVNGDRFETIGKVTLLK